MILCIKFPHIKLVTAFVLILFKYIEKEECPRVKIWNRYLRKFNCNFYYV